MKKIPCVYILTNYKNGTLYIRVTSNLSKRIWEHKQKIVNGFSKKYSLNQLVYYELHQTMELAITRERQIKKWNRLWKLRLINNMNREWLDLSDELI